MENLIHSKKPMLLGFIFLFCFLPISITFAQEDQGADGGGISSSEVREIPQMSVPNILIDFEEFEEGPTTFEEIQQNNPGSCLSGLTFNTRLAVGVYNFQTDGGKALSPNPDGVSGLYIVDVDGLYGEADSLVININGIVDELGFEIGDWGGNFNIELFRDGESVGFISVSTANNNRIHVIQSDIPFNQAELTALPEQPLADWVVPSLRIPTVCNIANVPTLSEWSMIALAAIIGIFSLFVLRKRVLMSN